MDLTKYTFISALTKEATYNGNPLQFGAIVERRFDQGRPGVAGEYRPQIREGSANHATIRIRAVEGFVPSIGDVMEVKDDYGNWEEWRVRGEKRSYGGVIELLCEIKGSRAVASGRSGISKLRVRG